MLFIVSAPSGTGKTTLVERLVKTTGRLKMSRSYTSRPPRADEKNGVDYNFVSRDEFERMAAANEFLEWADVFGSLYGTAAEHLHRSHQASERGREGGCVAAVKQDRNQVDVNAERHRGAEAERQDEPAERGVTQGRSERNIRASSGISVCMRRRSTIGVESQVLGSASQ